MGLEKLDGAATNAQDKGADSLKLGLIGIVLAYLGFGLLIRGRWFLQVIPGLDVIYLEWAFILCFTIGFILGFISRRCVFGKFAMLLNLAPPALLLYIWIIAPVPKW